MANTDIVAGIETIRLKMHQADEAKANMNRDVGAAITIASQVAAETSLEAERVMRFIPVISTFIGDYKTISFVSEAEV